MFIISAVPQCSAFFVTKFRSFLNLRRTPGTKQIIMDSALPSGLYTYIVIVALCGKSLEDYSSIRRRPRSKKNQSFACLPRGLEELEWVRVSHTSKQNPVLQPPRVSNFMWFMYNSGIVTRTLQTNPHKELQRIKIGLERVQKPNNGVLLKKSAEDSQGSTPSIKHPIPSGAGRCLRTCDTPQNLHSTKRCWAELFALVLLDWSATPVHDVPMPAWLDK